MITDKELLEMAYTILKRVYWSGLDAYISSRLQEWLRIYENRLTQNSKEI